MDLCTIGTEQGGVFQAAQQDGVAIPDVITASSPTAATRRTPQRPRRGQPSVI
jgi:hypothetical protein